MAFAEKDVSQDYQAAVEMIRKSGQQGIPVITIDDEVVVGFDRPRLERILAAKGIGQANEQAGAVGAEGPARPRPRVVFGAAIADASRIMLQQGRVPVFGAYVGKVAPGSPAHRAGLQPGDIVTELNLRPITNAETMEQALAALDPGGIARLVFTRGDRALRSEVRV